MADVGFSQFIIKINIEENQIKRFNGQYTRSEIIIFRP